jgi:hypothetical protein
MNGDARFAREHRTIRNAIMILLFWSLAALSVVGADRHIAATSPLSIAVKLCAIGVAAAACVRLCETDSPIEDALMVGAAWLGLSTLTEILMSSRSARGWFELLGSPSTPMVRNVLLLAWAMGPVLIALVGGRRSNLPFRQRDSPLLPSPPIRSRNAGSDSLIREGSLENLPQPASHSGRAPSELDLRA